MSTRLEQLLARIDPKMTLDQTAARADQALNTFSWGSGQITDRSEFEDCLTDFFCHVDAKVLGVSSSLHAEHRDFQWGRCGVLLTQLYGQSGDKVAFDMARTGKAGGLYAVLKAMALKIAEAYAENEINALISDYWNRLTVDQQLAAPDEYLEHYGHLLPSELTEAGAVRIRANFSTVLAQHPEMIRKLRRTGV